MEPRIDPLLSLVSENACFERRPVPTGLQQLHCPEEHCGLETRFVFRLGSESFMLVAVSFSLKIRSSAYYVSSSRTFYLALACRRAVLPALVGSACCDSGLFSFFLGFSTLTGSRGCLWKRGICWQSKVITRCETPTNFQTLAHKSHFPRERQ